MKVKAKGSSDEWAGYYGNYRRRGGDVFELVPVNMRVRGKDGKESVVVIEAEAQFSDRWMIKADESAPVSKPASKRKFDAGGSVPAPVSGEESDKSVL